MCQCLGLVLTALYSGLMSHLFAHHHLMVGRIARLSLACKLESFLMNQTIVVWQLVVPPHQSLKYICSRLYVLF